MQYTLPDIMFAFNYLSIHACSQSASSFQGIKYIIRYLSVCPYHSIMYPAVLDVTTTHGLRQEVSPGKFQSQNISNGLVAFEDEVEGRAPN